MMVAMVRAFISVAFGFGKLGHYRKLPILERDSSQFPHNQLNNLLIDGFG